MSELNTYTLTAAVALPHESRVEFVRKVQALAKELGDAGDVVLKPAVEAKEVEQPVRGGMGRKKPSMAERWNRE